MYKYTYMAVFYSLFSALPVQYIIVLFSISHVAGYRLLAVCSSHKNTFSPDHAGTCTCTCIHVYIVVEFTCSSGFPLQLYAWICKLPWCLRTPAVYMHMCKYSTGHENFTFQSMRKSFCDPRHQSNSRVHKLKGHVHSMHFIHM